MAVKPSKRAKETTSQGSTSPEASLRLRQQSENWPSSVDGLGKFVREVVVKQPRYRRKRPSPSKPKPKPKHPKNQPLKHGGRGWLHRPVRN